MGEKESDKRWTHESKLLLVNKRLEMEGDFIGKKKKRTTLWRTVLSEITKVQPDFPFNSEEIYRKFLNLVGTYKRIKKRNKTSGEAATSWEYFDMFNEIYGSRDSITVPAENLDSSLVDYEIFESNNEPSTSSTEISRSRENNNKSDIIEFLKEEGKEDKKLLKELIDVEKAKLEIEKEKLKILQNMYQKM